ncbi:MAG: tripartite tricarboxylate transporter substrate-binding protein [Proteobacteria bacterium]|nr:tripartite tricarboxylate transporter substrate-binding protein [Pseudomonadota bacterium]
MHRRCLALGLPFAFAFAVAAPAVALAQPITGPGGFPAKSVRVVVPAASGSLTDPVARIVSDELGRRTGQSWVIENRPGAGGMIGSEAVARAVPDGYTLLFSANNLVITPSLFSKVPYRVLEDFTPIALVGRGDNLLVASGAAGIKSVKDLVTRARASANPIDYTSPLIGSAAHLTVELFRTSAKIPLNHVAYKDSTQGTSDTLSGRIPVNIMGISTALPHIRAGRLVPLAWTGAKRHPDIPDTPTFVEAGYPAVHLGLWFGYFGPAKLPAPQVGFLDQQVAAAMKAPAVVEKLAGMSIDPDSGGAKLLGEMMAREYPIYAKVVAEAGIKLD